jgi:RHS repeat-associated protein
MGGAGGVGGLLWVTLHTTSGAAPGTHFAAYDGNGNVVALVRATTGTETACYEYGPFGEPIRISGPAAALNPFRFSTKRTWNAIDLVLYEYRAYSPSLGRWSSRDPLQEDGGNNLCCFAANDAVDNIDLLGMLVGSVKIDPWQPIKTDKWYNHERGWIFGAIWTPPTGGELG